MYKRMTELSSTLEAREEASRRSLFACDDETVGDGKGIVETLDLTVVGKVDHVLGHSCPYDRAEIKNEGRWMQVEDLCRAEVETRSDCASSELGRRIEGVFMWFMGAAAFKGFTECNGKNM